MQRRPDAAQHTLGNNPIIKCSWLTWQAEPGSPRFLLHKGHVKKVSSHFSLRFVSSCLKLQNLHMLESSWVNQVQVNMLFFLGC